MVPNRLQAHNHNHVGLPPGMNPKYGLSCSPRWGRFLRGDCCLKQTAFSRNELPRNFQRPGTLKAGRLAREDGGVIPGQNVIPDRKE
jgi:hypothetical protein